MKNPHSLFALLAAGGFYLPNAHAVPDKGGNGGKALYCPDEGTREVLEYRRKEFGFTPIRDIEGDTALDKALNLVKRIEKINPKRVAYLSEKLRTFKDQSRPAGDGEMEKTNDTNQVSYCTGGQVYQVVRQITPRTKFEKPYMVHWKRMNELPLFQQALMMTHEVILSETIAQEISGADYAARLNAFLFSEELSGALALHDRDPSTLPDLINTYADVLQGSGLLYSNMSGAGKDPTLREVLEAFREIESELRFIVHVPSLSSDLFSQCKTTPRYNRRGKLIGSFTEIEFPLVDTFRSTPNCLAMSKNLNLHRDPRGYVSFWFTYGTLNSAHSFETH